jgi:hypothetical protein
MLIASTRALFHAVTPQITSTATDAILNWRRCRYPDAARIVGSNVSLSVVQERQRERLQIEPSDRFGVIGIQAVPLDAVLAELIEMAVTQTRQRRTPVTVSTDSTLGGRPLQNGKKRTLKGIKLQGIRTVLWFG